MKNLNIILAFAAAVAVGAFVGCGDMGGADAGDGSCTTDATCGTGLGCHPVLKKCIATCTGGADCPSSAKTCATLNGSTKSFCQCSTDALCGTDLICSNLTKRCESKCTSNASCPSGATCSVDAGQCIGGASDAGTDGGTDAGTVDAGPACDLGTCTGGKVCNFTTGACETAATCSTANAQPDTCGYAGFCADTTCRQVEAATCVNFQQTSSMPTFNARTSTGPIIYGFTDETIDDATFCTAPALAYTLTLKAYSNTDFPAASAALPGFFYVKSDGSKIGVVANIMRPSGYVKNPTHPKMATFKVTLCSSTVTSNLGAGFYFDNGNETCVVAAGGMSP